MFNAKNLTLTAGSKNLDILCLYSSRLEPGFASICSSKSTKLGRFSNSKEWSKQPLNSQKRRFRVSILILRDGASERILHQNCFSVAREIIILSPSKS